MADLAHLTLGGFRITLVRSGCFWWDGGVYFGIVPKSLWSKRMPPDEQNRVPLAFNSYIIETPEKTVLIETGGGYHFDPKSRERMNMPEAVTPLPELFSQHGISPEKIDVVINTHLHWDHCSGNMLEGRPAFPNAQYFTQRGELEYAKSRNPRDSISYIDANYMPLLDSGRMTLLNGDAELTPGVTVEVAPGHNRDMMIVKARSQGQTFCMLADLVASSEHLKPTWVMAFDLYPLTVIETRTKVLTQAAQENWWCGFGHDCNTAFATITQDYKLHATL